MKEKDPRSILAHYPIGDAISISQLTSGFIHATYHVKTATDDYILQTLGSIFTETTVEDMEKVTAHLIRKGVIAPQIIQTKNGIPFHKDIEGRLWRLMTFIEGKTYEALPHDSYAAEAGKVLAQFHNAMEDFDPNELKSEPILHQTKEIYDAFCEVYDILMKTQTDADQRACYDYIKKTMPSLMLPANLPTTIIHGDPKISNVVFRDNEGICLIDLDTCMKHTPLMDMGDALRWCAISEEAFPNTVSLSRFENTIQGYGKIKPISPEMKKYIVQAFAVVTLGLASRFAKDIHDDSYFDWNKKNYASRAEHNRARTKSLVSLTQDILLKESEMREILKKY